MQPIPITEAMLADLVKPELITYKAPAGLEDSVHDVQGAFEMGVPHRQTPDRIYIPLQLEEGELEALLRGEPVWLVVMGHRMPVFSLAVRPTAHDGVVEFVDGPQDGKLTYLRVIKDLAEAGDVPLEEAGFEDEGGVYHFVSGSLVWTPVSISQEES